MSIRFCVFSDPITLGKLITISRDNGDLYVAYGRGTGLPTSACVVDCALNGDISDEIFSPSKDYAFPKKKKINEKFNNVLWCSTVFILLTQK